MNNLTTYQCVRNSTVQKTVTIQEWFNLIKNYPNAEAVLMARTAKQASVADPTNHVKKAAYDNIKCNKFPTICFNSVIDGYRLTENYLESTGLMYIDVDKNEFTLDKVDKTKIYAAYKSIGGIGYALLVRVDGLTLENYEDTFNYVIEDLNLWDYYDKAAKGMIQQSVASSDPDIFINNSPLIYDSITSLKTYPTTHNISKEKKHISLVGYKIDNVVYYDNTCSFDFDGKEYIQNWVEGFNFVKCYLPNMKLTDKRKRTLLSYATNLVWLNPCINYDHALSILENVNDRICSLPLSHVQIQNILNTVFKQKVECKLFPHVTKRRIIFNPLSALNKSDKLSICGVLIKEKFAVEGCERLNEIIEGWDYALLGKLSIAKIAVNSDMNKKTVAKYYPIFKSFVTDLNNEYMLKNNSLKLAQRLVKQDVNPISCGWAKEGEGQLLVSASDIKKTAVRRIQPISITNERGLKIQVVENVLVSNEVLNYFATAVKKNANFYTYENYAALVIGDKLRIGYIPK